MVKKKATVEKQYPDYEVVLSELKSFDNFTDRLIVIFDKDTSRVNKYKAFKFNASGKNIEKISTLSFQNAIKILESNKIEKYDLEVSTDEAIQQIFSNVVTEYEVINQFITTDSKKTPVIKSDTNINLFDFYAIKLAKKVGEEVRTITLFRRYHKQTSHFKKSFKYYFDSKELVEFNKAVITLDDQVDVIEYMGVFYVLNRNAFNSIFSFKDFFEKVLENKKKDFINSKIIVNSEKMIEDCKTDGRYIKRMAKFLIAGDYDEITKNKEKIKEIVKGYKLKIKVSKTNEIIYKDKNDLNEILNLLLEHYVVSALTEKRMLAKAIEEYSVG